MSDKNILYLIVSSYPFGNRETFLDSEIKVLSGFFSRIFLVIPEGGSFRSKKPERAIPENVEVLLLNTSNSGLRKFSGFRRILSSALAEELYFIRNVYKLKLVLNQFKILLGFSSMSVQLGGQLLKHIQANQFSPERITLYSYWFTYASGAIALLKSREPAFRAVTRVHGWDCFFDRSPDHYLPLRPWIISQLDQTVPVSKTGQEYLLDLLGRERFREKIATYYLGTGNFDKPESGSFRMNSIHLVSIAFVDPVKRLEMIAGALGKIHGLNIRWTHIGGGIALSDLKAYATKRTEGSPEVSISFLGDLTQQQVYTFLRTEQPDALLCTSRSEGLPVSMMESMAHGIPVISVDVGGVSEIVKDGKNGMLLAADCSETELAEAIASFANLPEERRSELRENAYSTYSQYFVAEKNHARFALEVLK